MYRKDKSIQMKSSASALYNNLSVLPIGNKSLTYFTVVHGNTVNMVSASADGLNFSHRQLQSKEESVALSSSLITQASWCVLPSRVLLVLASQKGIQMYESDGSIMVYWHALDALETPQAQAVFARGIAPAGGRYICLMFCSVTCSSVKLWDGMIAAAYGSGQIRLYDAATGDITAELDAHARWIYTLDIAPESGRLLSGAEDSFVQIWQLSRCAETGAIEVAHRHSECVTDTQVCGARFCDPQGTSFAVTGYDLSEIIRYVQV
ncbi:WD repeat-containing protein 54 [Pseudophryne corroboree]|uniref:WD repeat-containing protein 54 n=1 Tax=Pseudophryne corroboree TaxID=495146 RepID=UPI0030819AE6